MCGLSSRWWSQTPNFSNRNILLVCMTNELAKMVSHTHTHVLEFCIYILCAISTLITLNLYRPNNMCEELNVYVCPMCRVA